jgi:membrane associated rhomboid family serine protease
MFRQRSGSSLCYACGKLNRVDAPVCFYCGVRRPGLWGFGPSLGRVVGRLDFARLVIVACAVAYAASLLVDPRAAFAPRGLFGILAPSGNALFVLGATGTLPWAYGRWWTVFTAIYLHGNLLHILFNMMWVRQLAPPVEELFGRARLIVIFTVAGAVGFVFSTMSGVRLTIGASGAIFGLLGAMVQYGRSRGGVFGVAVFRQYGQWALVIFAMGFLMPGIDNFAHAGGFLAGYLTAWLLGHRERGAETGLHRVAALMLVGLTLLGFALSVWTAFAR